MIAIQKILQSIIWMKELTICKNLLEQVILLVIIHLLKDMLILQRLLTPDQQHIQVEFIPLL